MARLFITPREMDLINDITKEVFKDIVGQAIYLYPISAVKTRTHDIYLESPEKIFENPIQIHCRVAWQRPEPHTSEFGYDKKWKIEAHIHSRDMFQREIKITPGDFFTYDEVFYEIVEAIETKNIFGQVEYNGGLHLVGRMSRRENFLAKIFGPTSEHLTDPDAVQNTFRQQRGLPENGDGITGDVRDLQRKGVLDAPLSAAEISPRATLSGSAGSAFYDEK